MFTTTTRHKYHYYNRNPVSSWQHSSSNCVAQNVGFSSIQLRNIKGKTDSSTRWLKRQSKDQYVKKAQQKGYRARSAFKLQDINQKHHFLRPGMTVVDLGAAPGSWTQMAVDVVKPNQTKNGKVISIDLLPIENIEGAIILQGDFLEEETVNKVEKALNGRSADVILSDMAPNTSGNKSLDHDRVMGLAETAFDFSQSVLKQNGSFICKMFDGESTQEFQKALRSSFQKVSRLKPSASRSESREFYFFCQSKI